MHWLQAALGRGLGEEAGKSLTCELNRTATGMEQDEDRNGKVDGDRDRGARDGEVDGDRDDERSRSGRNAGGSRDVRGRLAADRDGRGRQRSSGRRQRWTRA